MRKFLNRFCISAFCCISSISGLATMEIVAAERFVARKVTNLGSPSFGAPTLPLGVVNGHLIFIAKNALTTALYRTDGTKIELIDNLHSIQPTSSLGDLDIAQVGNELYFRAVGSDGAEVFATDGISLRQVADIVPGPAGSLPHNFEVLNGKLLFEGVSGPAGPSPAPIRYFHSDGTTVEQFPVALKGSVRLNNQLVLGGFVPGIGTLSPYATDGESLIPISSISGEELIEPEHFTRVDDWVYFTAGGLSDPGIHRTDGTVAELIANLDTFTFTNKVDSAFQIGGRFFVTVDDFLNDELHIYQTSGDTPTEVLKIPYVSATPRPQYSDGERTFFHVRSGAGTTLQIFDGTNLNVLSENDYGVLPLGDRIFLYRGTPSANSALAELVDDKIVPLGPGAIPIAEFQDEIVAVNPGAGPFDRYPLWYSQDGQLVSLADTGVSYSSIPIREPFVFVEFEGQLYFGGIEGNNRQLYAIVPVPEATSLYLSVVAVLSLLSGKRQIILHRNDV